jgi:pyruvate ferredoxin oxidoreductase alpha subunit
MNDKQSRRHFVSGNEAVALGVRLARAQVISAYPITPQTIVVERLSEMVEDGSLKAQFMHVESEHSAISAAMGASAVGARTFTASSSQGLLYMAEGLHYASGGRFPIVMMNACRSVALPWSIFGDQRDSLSLLDSGWMQVYVEDAQEALDMTLQAYRIAEAEGILTPIMVNLDGFILTHTYEPVDEPAQSEVDAFLPPFATPNKMDLDQPRSLGFSTSPGDNQEFKYQQHRAMMKAIRVIEETDRAFAARFGRSYQGLIETHRCEDAEVILVALGSVCGTARVVVDKLRSEGKAVGLVKLRFMRPFPDDHLRAVLGKARVVGVLDKDISFGYEGTVFTNVNSSLKHLANSPCCHNFIGGLGGRSISKEDIEQIYTTLLKSGPQQPVDRVQFFNMRCEIHD